MHKTPNPNDWLLAEILAGMQRLMCLSLDHTPAAEVIAGTAAAWREAMGDQRDWQMRRDTVGVREAFARLARSRTRWPAPANFLQALPPLALDTSAELARDVEMETLRADLTHFRACNLLWRDGHADELFDIPRCFGPRQLARITL